MGYFSNLALEIEEALCDGATVKQIAGKFNISEAEVKAVIEQLEDCDRDPQPAMNMFGTPVDNSGFYGMN